MKLLDALQWRYAVKKMNGVDLSNLQLNTNELMVNQNV